MFLLFQFQYCVTGTSYNECQLKTYTHSVAYFFVSCLTLLIQLYSLCYPSTRFNCLPFLVFFFIILLVFMLCQFYTRPLTHTLVFPLTIPIYSCTALLYKFASCLFLYFPLFSLNIRRQKANKIWTGLYFFLSDFETTTVYSDKIKPYSE